MAISDFANCQKVEMLDSKSSNAEMADSSAVFADLKVGDTLLISYQATGCFHFRSGEYRIYKSVNETFVEKSMKYTLQEKHA